MENGVWKFYPNTIFTLPILKSRSTFLRLLSYKQSFFATYLKQLCNRLKIRFYRIIFVTLALASKNGLSEDSPKQSIYEYSEFLRVKEDELRKLANRLTTDTI